MLLKAKGIYFVLIGFAYIGFTISIGWVPYWVMILSVLLVAFSYAGKLKGMF